MEKSNKKRRNAFIVGITVLCLAVGIIIAYLLIDRSKTNTVVVGKGDADITEIFEKPPKLEEGANIYQKTVQISNTGENPCFVRVYMAFSDTSIEKISWFYKADSGETIKNAPAEDSAKWKAAANISDWLPEDWVYDPDGYFYYTKPVDKGEVTQPLITWVKTVFGSDNIKPYDILVYAETVQTVSGSVDYGLDENKDDSGNYQWQKVWNSFLRVS